MNIFKNNEGDTGSRLGIFFDKHECFFELPPVDDEKGLNVIYERVKEEAILKRARYTNLKMF